MQNIPAAKVYFPEEDRKHILEKIDEVLGTGYLTLGKYGKEFEKNFSEYTDAKYAVSVSSGTAALEASLRALDVKGKSVIVPTNTFFATPASVIHAGGTVIFSEITENLCMDPESVRKSITEDTKGVIVVHIGGIVPPQIKEIKEICEEKGLFLLEDAAHAHGSSLNGKKAGTFGDIAAFSFYPTKVMTSGEGGMITTDNEELQKKTMILRDQGKLDFSSNYHVDMGHSWRMSEVHAILGNAHLARLGDFIKERKMIAKIYDEELGKIEGIEPVSIPEGCEPNYYKYCALLKDGSTRAEMKKKLKEEYKVSLSGEVYEVPCHLQPVFKDMYEYKGGEFPVAEDLCSRHICLPVFPTMTVEMAKRVTDSLKEVM